MAHHRHDNHKHEHSLSCGHTKIRYGDHIDYIHDGHLHHKHENHWDECKIEVSDKNPASCTPVQSDCTHNEDCGHEMVPHGDHIDDHGPVEVI